MAIVDVDFVSDGCVEEIVVCLSCFCVYGGEMGKKRGQGKVARERVGRERK